MRMRAPMLDAEQLAPPADGHRHLHLPAPPAPGPPRQPHHLAPARRRAQHPRLPLPHQLRPQPRGPRPQRAGGPRHAVADAGVGGRGGIGALVYAALRRPQLRQFPQPLHQLSAAAREGNDR